MSDYSEELLEPLTEYKRTLAEVCYRVAHHEPGAYGGGPISRKAAMTLRMRMESNCASEPNPM